MIYVGSSDQSVYAFGMASSPASTSAPAATPPLPIRADAPAYGANVVGQTFDPSDQNTIAGNSFVATARAEVNPIRIYLHTLDSINPGLQAAIYTDDGGTPENLVWSSESVSASTTGWTTIPVSNVILNTSQTYWLLFNAAGATTGGVFTNYVGTGWSGGQPFGSWPSQEPPGVATRHQVSIAATVVWDPLRTFPRLPL